MKKKIIILILLIIALISLVLYYTLATDITMKETTGEADLTYNIDITDTDGRTITVEAGKIKVFDIFITNKNGGSIKYGLAYKPNSSTDIKVKKLDNSINDVTGIIENNTTLQVTLVIDNKSTSSLTYNIIPITGYEKGGNLTVSSGYTMVSEVYKFAVNLDKSGANAPKLDINMIPVMYDGTNWVKADKKNSEKDYQWYDYNNKQWANAVLVTSANRNTYVNASVGTIIPEADVLAYYVWIPRYKYKVWNINKVIGTDSYDAYHKGIDIVFESGIESTGTIKCADYSFKTPTSIAPNETCSGSNGEYYTHPAFTFGDKEIEGIWVGKFEMSTNGTRTHIQIKPNITSLRSTSIDEFYLKIKNMQLSNNIYGLNSDTNKLDSHVIKNMEWGAVAYLTNSNYGRCINGVCTEVAINPNANYSTGGSDYVTNVNMSTTGNIYGIYDMNGGSFESVMANVSSTNGSYQYFFSNDPSNFVYSPTTAKYIDTYAYYTSTHAQVSYNRARLGDATGEIVLEDWSGWYDDRMEFPDASNRWFYRGGQYIFQSTTAGIFAFEKYDGTDLANTSTRASLIVY